MTPVRRTRPGWAVAAGILALALGVGACGGDDDRTVASTTTVAVTEPSTTTAAPAASGRFCELVRGYLERLPKLVAAFSDPAAVRQLLADTEPIVQQAEAAAPPELKADVALLATSSRELLVVLERVDFDFAKVPPQDVARIQTPEVQAAGQRLAAYNKDVCGVG